MIVLENVQEKKAKYLLVPASHMGGFDAFLCRV